MVVRGVRMFSGYGPDPEGWGLWEITEFCGLTLGGGVPEDLSGPAPGSDREQVSDKPQHIRLVVSHRSLR
jgi:hypothetical protein